MRLADLPGPVGAEALDSRIGALDGLAGVGAAADIDALRAALRRRHLLVVRGIELSGEAQAAFVARFGPLLSERHLWGYVSNARPDGIVREGALLFHSDFAFTRAPLEAISLHAIDVPAGGAPTLFADAVAAVDRLPAELRARLDGREVVNIYDFSGPDDQPMYAERVAARSPRVTHPIVAAHPRTGQPVIMANQLHSDRIVGMGVGKGRAVLDELFAVLYDPAHVYEHRWQRGDLVLWDNVAVHHARPPFDRTQARTLQRVTLGSYTAGELIPDLAQLLTERNKWGQSPAVTPPGAGGWCRS